VGIGARDQWLPAGKVWDPGRESGEGGPDTPLLGCECGIGAVFSSGALCMGMAFPDECPALPARTGQRHPTDGGLQQDGLERPRWIDEVIPSLC
jgi:hypothetical protein